MWMADKPGILRNCAMLFWFKNTLQVTLRSWYIYMQYLADNETSLPFLSSNGKAYNNDLLPYTYADSIS
jgi:hypothetical protein